MSASEWGICGLLFLAVVVVRRSTPYPIVAGILFFGTATASIWYWWPTDKDFATSWMHLHTTIFDVAEKQDRVALHPHHQWPPSLHQVYPNLNLVDQEGRRTSLAEFKGKVILLEPVGMPCRACIAFAGGHEKGAFDQFAPQGDLRSIDYYAREYGGVDLNDARIVVVQILFYDKNMQAPTIDDARRWAQHFGLQRAKNRVVLVAEPYLLGSTTHAMIPGFHLIDKNFVLRYDSTGHPPRHDLYTELLPNIHRLLHE